LILELVRFPTPKFVVAGNIVAWVLARNALNELCAVTCTVTCNRITAPKAKMAAVPDDITPYIRISSRRIGLGTVLALYIRKQSIWRG
jgi:hypothetical protein